MTAPTRKPKQSGLWSRSDRDFYVEEPRASRALFAVECFVGAIHDPSCGSGNIVRSARAAGYLATGSDLVKRVDETWFTGESNFLIRQTAPPAPNFVMNPPFFHAAGTEAFIRKALALALGKVAVFAEIGFLAGQARATGLWKDHPPTRIYSISPRINCPPASYLEAGGEAKGGTADWVWLVWDLAAPASAPTFRWLNAPVKKAPALVSEAGA